MKRKPRQLFNLGEMMRNASIAAYDINRSIQKIAKDHPERADALEQEAIVGLLRKVREFERELADGQRVVH